MDLHLNGCAVLVTGASKGIGLAIVEAMLAEGARVAAVSRNGSEALASLAGELLHVPADLSEPGAPEAAVDRAVDAFGGLDVLVNNAGGPPPGDSLPHAGFLARGDEEWRAILEFNLLSAVRASRAAIPRFVERGDGTIVNVASSAARQPAPINLDYAAAKAAMLNLTKSLAEEFGPSGVRVNAVSPGATITPWWTDEGGAADIIARQVGSSREQVLASLAPASMGMLTGRLVEPREVADVVALLASPRSGSTTGAEFVVDGGSTRAL